MTKIDRTQPGVTIETGGNAPTTCTQCKPLFYSPEYGATTVLCTPCAQRKLKAVAQQKRYHMFLVALHKGCRYCKADIRHSDGHIFIERVIETVLGVVVLIATGFLFGAVLGLTQGSMGL